MQKKTLNFKTYSSLKVGQKEEVLVVEDYDESLKDFYLIGSCNNTLIGTKPPPLMMLSKKFDFIKIEDNLLKIGAATPSGKISSFCKKNNIKNFEFLSHLPGKLGGLIFMNAGLKEYEISNYLVDVTLSSGKKRGDEIEFEYRKSGIDEIIFEASFILEYGYDVNRVEIFKKMRSNQPKTPSAGSCFKNPPNDYAGRLIEAVGLKGLRVGDMEFSSQHANFLVNHKDGTFDDAIYLIQEAQKRVFSEFGIKLECEIEILDTIKKSIY